MIWKFLELIVGDLLENSLMKLHNAKFQIFILCLENCYTVITIHYVGEVTLTCYWEMK